MDDVEKDYSSTPPVVETARHRAEQLQIISSFERQVRILVQEYYQDPDSVSEEILTPEQAEEHLQEQLEDLRNVLLDSLKDKIEQVYQDAPAKLYEEIVWRLVKDRLTRTFGYYQAISRSKALVGQLNNEVGDQAFEVGSDLAKLLSSLDEVYFVRQLGESLGLAPNDVERIVNHQIDRQFKPRARLIKE